MKLLSGILIFLVIILLFVALIAFQANLAVSQTFLSGRHFTAAYDKYDPTPYLLEKAITRPNPTEPATQTGDIYYYLDSYLNREWFENETPGLLKGTYSYLTGASSILPVIDIKPVKGFHTRLCPLLYQFLSL